MRAAVKTRVGRSARGVAAQAACLLACAALAACTGPKKTSGVKSASAYRAELCAASEKINLYLAENTPANTSRQELQQAVGELARAYSKISAEAAPLRGKTGDPAYAAVAGDAEDGVIVAGNLAAALAADPVKHADALAQLGAAVADWVAYLDALERDGGDAFHPTRWWEEPAWREATAGAPVE